MSDAWDDIAIGMKVETENKDCGPLKNVFPDCIWVATVLRIEGR